MDIEKIKQYVEDFINEHLESYEKANNLKVGFRFVEKDPFDLDFTGALEIQIDNCKPKHYFYDCEYVDIEESISMLICSDIYDYLRDK